ncbi:required for meiotic nuclear division protein 1 homolog [Lycorma delicatula]|uniref:required for meiotic nuclear division protein 1 homolog n=1 Tax=Lycorma delicatula TaxID=130591 RepID=UPI003F511A5C
MYLLNSHLKCGINLLASFKSVLHVNNTYTISNNVRTFFWPVLNYQSRKLCYSTNLLQNKTRLNALKIISNQLRLQHSFASIITPLQASKKSRTYRKKVLEKDEKFNSITAYATADSYDLESLRSGLLRDTIYIPTDIEDFNCINVIFAQAPASSGEQKQIFFFQEGAVVFWNVSDDECSNILKFIKQFEDSSYSEFLVQSEQEVMPYLYSGDIKKSDLANNQIILAPPVDKTEAVLDKYTFSNAMALSVKLGIWEGVLEYHIASIELITKDLKIGNKIKITKPEVLKKTGEIFALRHSVNLSSDALDIPDFYWDRDELEKLYVKMINYFSIARRTKVVNEKLSHCLELLDLISSNINDEHHVRLELMIIALIMVEVGIAIIHLLIL